MGWGSMADTGAEAALGRGGGTGAAGGIGGTGATGAAGVTGGTGAVGAAGATGGTGAVGAAGAPGGTGAAGQAGPVGDASLATRRRTSPDVVRTLSATDPSPTTSVRRPRPPSAACGPVARTSPVIVWASRRTGLSVTTSTSPDTELRAVTCADGEPRLHAEIAAGAARLDRLGAAPGHGGVRTRCAPRGRYSPMRRRPRRRTSSPPAPGRPRSRSGGLPDAVAQRLAPARPVASTLPLIVRSEIAAVRGTSMSRSGDGRPKICSGPKADAPRLRRGCGRRRARPRCGGLPVQRAAVAGPGRSTRSPSTPRRRRSAVATRTMSTVAAWLERELADGGAGARGVGHSGGPPESRGWPRRPPRRSGRGPAKALEDVAPCRPGSPRQWSRQRAGQRAGQRRPEPGPARRGAPNPSGAHERLDAGPDRGVADAGAPAPCRGRLPRLRRKLSRTTRLLAGEPGVPPDPELALDGGGAGHRSAGGSRRARPQQTGQVAMTSCGTDRTSHISSCFSSL